MGVLLIVLIFTILFGFLLIFALKKTSKRVPGEKAADLPPNLQGLDFDHFYSLSYKLLEKLGLKLKESYRDRDNEADIFAENQTPFIGGPVIVHPHLKKTHHTLSGYIIKFLCRAFLSRWKRDRL